MYLFLKAVTFQIHPLLQFPKPFQTIVFLEVVKIVHGLISLRQAISSSLKTTNNHLGLNLENMVKYVLVKEHFLLDQLRSYQIIFELVQ